jgi:hypothetical protein
MPSVSQNMLLADLPADGLQASLRSSLRPVTDYTFFEVISACG